MHAYCMRQQPARDRAAATQKECCQLVTRNIKASTSKQGKSLHPCPFPGSNTYNSCTSTPVLREDQSSVMSGPQGQGGCSCRYHVCMHAMPTACTGSEPAQANPPRASESGRCHSSHAGMRSCDVPYMREPQGVLMGCSTCGAAVTVCTCP